jgi:hypothetical protein
MIQISETRRAQKKMDRAMQLAKQLKKDAAELYQHLQSSDNIVEQEESLLKHYNCMISGSEIISTLIKEVLSTDRGPFGTPVIDQADEYLHALYPRMTYLLSLIDAVVYKSDVYYTLNHECEILHEISGAVTFLLCQKVKKYA